MLDCFILLRYKTLSIKLEIQMKNIIFTLCVFALGLTLIKKATAQTEILNSTFMTTSAVK